MPFAVTKNERTLLALLVCLLLLGLGLWLVLCFAGGESCRPVRLDRSNRGGEHNFRPKN